MKLINRFWAIPAILMFMSAGFVLAEATLPAWEPGFNWSVQTHLDIHMKDPDTSDQVDMIIVDDAPPYICMDIVQRRLTKGEMREYEVYRLTFSGAVSGEGTADVNLMDVEIPIELRNGTQVGETWVDTGTLGTVYTTRFITGDLWAYYLFSWRRVGDFQITFNEEYEPPRDTASFPIETGNQWEDEMKVFFYGRYVMNYDLGSGPETAEDNFDDFALFNLTYDVVGIEDFKTWETYRVEGTDPDWDGMILSRYAGEALNYAFLQMTNLDMPEQGLLIRELKLEMMDFDLTPFPTPTPTPTPDPSVTGMTLHLNKEVYTRNDTFRLSRTLVNAGAAINVDEYIILDVYGSYWFWPEWSETVSSQTRNLAAGTVYTDEVALTFVWPDVTGSAEDLRFWGAMLDSSGQTLHGNYDMLTWGYH